MSKLNGNLIEINAHTNFYSCMRVWIAISTIIQKWKVVEILFHTKTFEFQEQRTDWIF